MRIIDRYICLEVISHKFLREAVLKFAVFVPRIVQLMDLIVRHAGGPGDVAELFLCTFPSVLSFTVPTAVLLGVLIGLGRMSADSELIAMNSVGMGLRRLLVPVGLLAIGAVTVTFCMTLWLGPLSVRTLRALEERLVTTQASFQVEPRVFDERFPRLVLYVQDVSAAATQWHGVFLAESGAGDTSRLTLAEDAIVMADRAQDKMEVHLRNGGTHEFTASDPTNYNLSAFAQRDMVVPTSSVANNTQRQLSNAERSFGQLIDQKGADAPEARIEIHRRLAFPLACLVFALAAIPLGARARRGGRSAALIIALLLVCGYYGVFVVGLGLARQGDLPPWLGIWAANILTGLGGILAMARIEQAQGTGRIGHAMAVVAAWRPWRRAAQPGRQPAQKPSQDEPAAPGKPIGSAAPPSDRTARLRRRRTLGRFPQLLDFYLVRSFLFYFILLMAAFLVLFELITLFDLLEDISRHHTALRDVLEYFRYLSYYLFYQFAPMGCLISALVTLAVMTKNNELVAFKAAGISLYRIAVPLITVSVFLAAGLFLMDSTYLPYASERQDALHNEIKGNPPQTYYQPRQQWIFGNNSKVYNYKLFDRDHGIFAGLNVFELDPTTFALRRRVYATRARWEEQQKSWILESGWIRDFQNGSVAHYAAFPVLELPEIDEPPLTSAGRFAKAAK